MHGDINIHARVAVVTKARLDDIRIAGDCLCEEKPLPKYDITILVDSSDSYDGKVFIDGKLADKKAFIETQKLIESKLIEKLQKKIGSRASFELIQFGGIKQLTPSYKPGSGGDAGSGGLRHYQVEVAKTSLDRASRRGRFADSLDGNGQLFLCLQDLNLRQMSSGRHQVLIIFTDEEWDLNGLKDHMGRLADRSTIAANTTRNFTTYPIIVRNNKLRELETKFIENELASRKSNYKKVYTEKFDKDVKKAFKEILADLE